MKNAIDILRSAGRAAFSSREYAALRGNKAYAHLELHRLHKKGVLELVRRGWWAFSDAMPEAIACAMSAPAYISFHTAIHLHGLTTQTHRIIQLAVARNAKRYDIFGTKVQEYRIPKSQFSNYEKKDNLLIALPEKAVADAIAIPRSCPAIIIAEALQQIDADKVRHYLESTEAKKRLGKLMQHA